MEAKRAGGLAVAVHSGHPRFGDPSQFIFWMQEPHSEHALELKRTNMVKTWVEAKKKKGYSITTPIRFRGPYYFTDHERIDLAPEHAGDPEYQFQAWFRRDSPLVVPADVIDMWAERRRKHGFPVNDPQPMGESLRPGTGMPLENDWLSDREKGLST